MRASRLVPGPLPEPGDLVTHGLGDGPSPGDLVAVATTNTSPCRSCSHERKVPKIRADSPASSSPPEAENAFSSSSIQRTTGAIFSAVLIARLKFFSLSPTYLL